GIAHQHCRVTPESQTEAQPLVSPSGSVISFDGRLDNRAELVECCRTLISPSSSDAALALAAYETFGDSFVAHLNGDFAFALYDPRRAQLVLARDVLGARRLFYCPLPTLLVFASEIKSILAQKEVTARLDEDGLADLVVNGYRDGHRTCFDGIYSVPPGHVVIATKHATTLRRYWDFNPSA